MPSEDAAQLALPGAEAATDDRATDGRVSSDRATGRYDTASNEEAAAVGRALLAQLRGEALTAAQKGILARAHSRAPQEARAAAPVLDRDRTLLRLSRGDHAELRVRWRRYRGSSPFLDFRRFERTDRGGLLPTRQGVTIRGHEVKRLLTSLVKLKALREASA